MKNDYENPMLRPLTENEEIELLSDDDINELPKCMDCSEPVYRKFRKMNIHRHCWEIGKADQERE